MRIFVEASVPKIAVILMMNGGAIPARKEGKLRTWVPPGTPNKLEPRCALDRHVAQICALEDFVDEKRRTAIHCEKVHAIPY